MVAGVLSLVDPISFVIPGTPVPWARAGMHGRVRFTPIPQANAIKDIQWLCKAAMRGAKPFEGPVAMEVVASWVAPPSWSNKKRAETLWYSSRPDIDNVVKIVADALKGVAYLDDAQIVRLMIEKIVTDTAQVAVKISLV